MKLTLLSILGLTFGAVFATAKEPVPVEVIHKFIQSHCINCHNDRKQKGNTNLRPLIDDAASVDLELLVSIFDQINLEEMPPENEEQPTIDEKSKMLAFLDGAIKDKGSSPLDKKLYQATETTLTTRHFSRESSWTQHPRRRHVSGVTAQKAILNESTAL
ncbi:hypothetical protein N8521_02160 [Akkermansiaceae bacterium]|nr:hypothetical protein [Akkermansiaceae bacterium]